tara:strand:- start:279 stop:494 length:216 start_codon:yes stop_codon:yes gene_type:complete
MVCLVIGVAFFVRVYGGLGELQVMEPAGFLNAPYEPAAHVAPNKRSFTDKDGKPLDSCKPVPLAQVTTLML